MNTAKQWRHEDMMVIAHEENSYREILGLCYSVHFSVPCPPSNDLLDHVFIFVVNFIIRNVAKRLRLQRVNSFCLFTYIQRIKNSFDI